jgi:hypothetical protein
LQHGGEGAVADRKRHLQDAAELTLERVGHSTVIDLFDRDL